MCGLPFLFHEPFFFCVDLALLFLSLSRLLLLLLHCMRVFLLGDPRLSGVLFCLVTFTLLLSSSTPSEHEDWRGYNPAARKSKNYIEDEPAERLASLVRLPIARTTLGSSNALVLAS
jgi:hypothetical protein